MKKLLMLSMMSLAVLATSCKKDNDDNGNGEPTPQPQAVTEENIEGTWKVAKMDTEMESELFGTKYLSVSSAKNINMTYVFTTNPNEVTINGTADVTTELYVDGTKAGSNTEEEEYNNETSTWILIENNSKIRVYISEFDEHVDMTITKFTTAEFQMEGSFTYEDVDIGIDVDVKSIIHLKK